MRPVARIAQSVEQGIENPRVLGSIPSPGTTYSENPAYGWVFAFLRPDSPSNCVRLFAATRLTPSGPARQARCSTPAALVRVRAPLIQRTQPMAGFLLFYSLPRTVGLISAAPSGIQCPSFLPLTSAIGYSSLTQAFSSDVTYCIESHKNVKMNLRFSRPSL